MRVGGGRRAGGARIERRGGGPEPTSNFANYSGPLTETILLGNLAVWAAPDPNTPGQRIEWDAKTLTPTNSPDLAAIVIPVYREGYVL